MGKKWKIYWFWFLPWRKIKRRYFW